MKVRNGFISNSSSSSFVLYGVHLDLDYEKDEELIEYFDEHGGWIRDDNVSLVGVTLAYDDGGVVEFHPNDSELKRKAKIVSEKIGVPISEFKFYAGTVYN